MSHANVWKGTCKREIVGKRFFLSGCSHIVISQVRVCEIIVWESLAYKKPNVASFSIT
jgi:hypothetical protein